MYTSTAERAVIRVIDSMRENLSEQLTVDDMARAAMFSKFHFSRMFQRVTGISPGRFLAAIRLQEAKRLLLTTRLSVADISLRVGYNSVGTFSTRFTKSVGLSPITYRRMGGYVTHISTRRPNTIARSSIEGRVYASSVTPGAGSGPGLIFMGLFPHRIPEGNPVRCAILGQAGDYCFSGVPDGTWYLLCHSVSGGILRMQQDRVEVATVGPISIHGGGTTTVNVHMKPASKLDPPVLLALLDNRRAALDRLANESLSA